MKINFCIT